MPYVRPTLILLAVALCAAGADFRLGIIGTDTSHVPAFTKMFNGDPAAPDHVAGARVVAAFKGGSKDIESSISRVEQFAEGAGPGPEGACRHALLSTGCPARTGGRQHAVYMDRDQLKTIHKV
jgi:hypothetical protein